MGIVLLHLMRRSSPTPVFHYSPPVHYVNIHARDISFYRSCSRGSSEATEALLVFYDQVMASDIHREESFLFLINLY